MIKRRGFWVIGYRGLALCLAVLVAAAALLTGVAWGASRLSASVAGTPQTRKLPVYCTDRGGKVVALTFDAAWGAEDTDTLLQIFEQYQISVTFFVVGQWVDNYPEELKKLADAGHEIGNHSNTHPYMTQLSAAEQLAQITACNEKIAAITGRLPAFFRAPYGDYNNTVIETVTSAKMTCVQWSVDSLDWKDPPVEDIVSRVTSKVSSGDIVLFHNAAKNTPAALPAIIEALQADGYTFLTVSEMVYTTEEYEINVEGRQCTTTASAVTTHTTSTASSTAGASTVTTAPTAG